MAKKFGKLLAVTAMLSGLAVGGIALYKKYVENNEGFDDDDFDEFDDFDDEEEPKREYVPITIEAPEKKETPKEDEAVEETVEETAKEDEAVEETVEETAKEEIVEETAEEEKEE